MTATEQAIVTEWRDGKAIPVALKAGAMVLEGTIAAVDEDGYAVASADVDGTQTPIGIWDYSAENDTAVNGDVVCVARRNNHFLLASDGSITQADLNKDVFVIDNQTVAKAGDPAAVAGRFMGFDLQYPTHVWVEID